MAVFPFFGGNKVLFSFLFKPYLSDYTLAILAGTCVGMREYVVNDLKSYWFGKYITKKKLIAIEKYTRAKPCNRECFKQMFNLQQKRRGPWFINFENHSGPTYNNDNVTDEQFLTRKLYDDLEVAWNDLPFYIYNKETRKMGNTLYVNKKALKVCNMGCYQVKYYPLEHPKNTRMMESKNWYYLYMFDNVIAVNSNFLLSQIESQTEDLAKYSRRVTEITKSLQYNQLLLTLKEHIK